ncbi:MAG: M81 family metallopeptidase [Acetobacteraceae bacterium]
MRIFAASLASETNTFASLPTGRRAFERALYCPPGTHPAWPTLCSAPIIAARRLAAAGHTIIEGTTAWAEPAGRIARSAYESLRDEILGQLSAALPIDIALFGLHGAMVADGYDDCEGDLLLRARAIAPGAVIGAELDLHAHLSEAMVGAADLIVAFKEFPHTDFLARAEDLARLLVASAEGRVRPVAALFDLRKIGGYMTSREPGRSFTDRLLAREGREGILSISVIHGFQAADVADVGMKILVYADGDVGSAERLAEGLAREILSWPEATATPHLKPEAALAAALAIPGCPVVLADRWDNPGGGVAGDSTVLLGALLARPEIPAAIGALWDPVAVELCHAAGTGAALDLRFCGKATPQSGVPVDARVEVRAVTEELVIPFRESRVSLGAATRIGIGALDVVLASTRAQTFSPEAFTRLGIRLEEKKVVAVKSSNHFHAAFRPIAAEVFYVDSGGPYPSDPLKIPYRKLRRPIAPLDAEPVSGRGLVAITSGKRMRLPGRERAAVSDG